MIIFGYGSLLNNVSLCKTIGKPLLFERDVLHGHKRVFDLRSHGRKNPATGVYSSVLNLQPDEDVSIVGVLFEVAANKVDELLERERGYDVMPIKLDSGREASTFVSRGHNCYEFVHDDHVQREYLDLCLKGATDLGVDVYENFLDTTYISEKTVREFLSQ